MTDPLKLVCPNCLGPKRAGDVWCAECRKAPREPGLRDPTEGENLGETSWDTDADGYREGAD